MVYTAFGPSYVAISINFLMAYFFFIMHEYFLGCLLCNIHLNTYFISTLKTVYEINKYIEVSLSLRRIHTYIEENLTFGHDHSFEL